MTIRIAGPAVAVLLATSAIASATQAAELLINGGFETDDFTGWTIGNLPDGNGSWIVNPNGANAPTSGFPVPMLAGGGQFIALTDQGGPGTHTLQQDFEAIAGGTYTLSFDAYSGNSVGVFLGNGIEFNGEPNQHFEVNLFGPNNVNLFKGDGDHAWTHQVYDLTPLITESGTYTLAFTEVDNQGFFNQGLDNVSVTSSGGGGAVPEPASWALMLTGFAGLGVVLRARRRLPLPG